MTRMHFQAIAAVIREAYANTSTLDNQSERDVAGQVVHEIAEGLSERFWKFNPAFDKARFLDACGVGENP